MYITKFDFMSYREILDYVFTSYIREFGESKYKTVYNKIMTSNKVSGLINTANHKCIVPGAKDYLYCINEIPYFIFSKGKTQALAALIALERWNEEINSKQFVLSEDGLKSRALIILEESN